MRKKVEHLESKAINKLYKDSFKKKLVKQIEAGTITQQQARRKYGVCKSVLLYWITKYGTEAERIKEMKWQEKRRRLVAIDENWRLRRELYEAQADAELCKRIIRLAKTRYGIDLKKNYGLWL